MPSDNKNYTIADLFDDTLDNTEKEMLINQIIESSDTASDVEMFLSAAGALTPTSQMKASNTLKQNVMKKIHEPSENGSSKNRKSFPLLRPTWKKIASIAAILLITLAIAPIFGPKLFDSNAKAMSLLDSSIEAIMQIKSMIVSLQVRSVPGDNLDLIDTKGDFIDYKLLKEFSPIEKWRIEKPGVTVVMDGQKQYRFMEKNGMGFVAGKDAGFVDWMKILLEPEKILKYEKAFADKHKAKYTIEKTATETILTVKAKALGSFQNTYNLNKSIPESNNRRVYHFEKQTNRLLSLEVFIDDNGKDVLVLKVNTVEYDKPIADNTFIITLPEDVKWTELKDMEPKKENCVAAKMADEAAKLWWEALSKQDWETVYKLESSLKNASIIDEFKKEYGGLQIISIGKSFKSGRYAGVYVPYEVKLKSGEILKHNLALRNDNAEKIWMIDGGY